MNIFIQEDKLITQHGWAQSYSCVLKQNIIYTNQHFVK